MGDVVNGLQYRGLGIADDVDDAGVCGLLLPSRERDLLDRAWSVVAEQLSASQSFNQLHGECNLQGHGTRMSLRLACTMIVVLSLCASPIGCRSTHADVEPAITFTKLPQSGDGSPTKLDPIEGTVTGAQRGDRVVLFARSGVWWVQPFANEPFTAIQNSKWKGTTHPGSSYAAVLVRPDYKPPPTIKALPVKGGGVLAVAVAEGVMLAQPKLKTLRFSGYEWEIRQTPSEPGGSLNIYDPANTWVDQKGFLHLKIARNGEGWTSAEVKLSRSLGYGSYRFIVQNIAHSEPAAVLNLSVWDNSGPPREMDIEISRWGEPNSKNAQYVIQPYYIPANVVRFNAPPGVLTHWLTWEPGKATFNTVRGAATSMTTPSVAHHVFTSGIPSPGAESIHMNLYVFANKNNPLRRESEVVIEHFEYLP